MPITKRMLDDKEFAKKLPSYYNYIKEKYDSEVKKYSAILNYGLDIDRYIELREKSETILHLLGDKLYHFSGRVSFRCSEEKLTITDNNGLKITYEGILVLDNNNYLPGNWESVIDSLYANRKKLLMEKKRKLNTIENVLLLEPTINSYTIIDNNIKIENFFDYDKSDDFVSAGIRVYVDQEIVFLYAKSGYDYPGLIIEPSLITYKSGDWELIIDEYANKKKLVKKRFKKNDL